MAKANDPEQVSDLVKGIMGLALTLWPLLSTGPICPYSRYVLKNGVEARKFVGTRDDN